MATPAQRLATYADLVTLPEHVVGELIGGELFVSPRPASRHARAASALQALLWMTFDSGGGGSSGSWWLLIEPELHLGEDALVPDLAGWRRDRMPEFPDVKFFTLAPDWVCEVASDSTRSLDRFRKLPRYAADGVRFVWLLEPLSRFLELFELGATGDYALHGVFEGESKVRAAPFEALELDLTLLWP